ncbi:MAG: hypothetical protein ACRD8Z_19580, partial [Nitrososphaeraceae archaeon]
FRVATKYELESSLKKSLNTKIIVAVVGPSTRKAVEENNVQVDVMPEIFKMGSMISALNDFFKYHNYKTSLKLKLST